MQEISKYLLDSVIPKLVADFKTLEFSPLDAQSLTTAMHERGVNIRYLSKVAEQCAAAKLTYIEELCIQEMIGTVPIPCTRISSSLSFTNWCMCVCMRVWRCVVRTAKHILAEQLRAVKPDKSKHSDHWFLAPCIAHFLSSFLGPNCGGAGLTDEQLSAAQVVLERLSKSNSAAAPAEESAAAKAEKKSAKKKATDKVKLKDGRRYDVPRSSGRCFAAGD